MAVMDAGLRFRLRKRTIAGLLLMAAVLAMILPRHGKWGELPVYMKAAERILRGDEIYRTDEVSAFTYPPFFVLPMVPLAPLSPITRARVWWFANLCLAGVVVFVIARMIWPTVARDANRRLRWALALLVAILAGRFLISPLEYQSHDLIVLALVVLAGLAMSSKQDGWAGICVGLAAACKATPLLFLPLFCWQRRYRAAALFLGTMIVATLLPDALFRSPDSRPWVVHWYDNFISKVQVDAPAQAAGAWSSWNMLNQGLSATIYRLSTPVESRGGIINVCLFALTDVSRQRLTLALELLVLGWLAWCTWLRRTRTGAFVAPPAKGTVEYFPKKESGGSADAGLAALTQVGMIVCAMLVLSPMSSSQHFGALLVPISACATYWLYRRRDPLIGGVLLAVFLFGSLAARDLLGSFAVWPQAIGCKTWLAMALLGGCGHILRAMEQPSRVVVQVFSASIEGGDSPSRPDSLPKTAATREIDLFPVQTLRLNSRPLEQPAKK
jgi:hypothetical protein